MTLARLMANGGKIARCETGHPNHWFSGRRHGDLPLRHMAGVSNSHSLPMVIDRILSVDPASSAPRLRRRRSSIHMAERLFDASRAGVERACGSRRDWRNWFRSRFFRADNSLSRFAPRAARGHCPDRSTRPSSWSHRRCCVLGEAPLIRQHFIDDPPGQKSVIAAPARADSSGGTIAAPVCRWSAQPMRGT